MTRFLAAGLNVAMIFLGGRRSFFWKRPGGLAKGFGCGHVSSGEVGERVILLFRVMMKSNCGESNEKFKSFFA